MGIYSAYEAVIPTKEGTTIDSIWAGSCLAPFFYGAIFFAMQLASCWLLFLSGYWSGNIKVKAPKFDMCSSLLRRDDKPVDSFPKQIG